MEMIWVWLAVVVVGLVIEFITNEMISIWFSAGGLVALIISACGIQPFSLDLSIQLTVFVVVSGVLLFFLRKICLKLLNKNNEKTNADSLIGKKVLLLDDVSDDIVSSAKIGDIVWNVKSKDEIKKGEKAEVVKIEGNSLIVKKEEK